MTTDSDRLREYAIEIHRQGATFVAHVPDLMLFADGTSAQQAYDNATEATQALIERYAALGRESRIPRPAAMQHREALKRTMTPFLLKAAVVAPIGVLLITAANVSFLYMLQDAPKHAAKVAGQYAMRKLITELRDFGAREITPEKDAEIRAALRAAVPRFEPYMEELAPLFRAAEESGAKSPS